MVRRLVVIGLAVVVAALPAGCGGSGSPSEHTARITTARTVAGMGHTIYVTVETEGKCFGTQQAPEISSVRVDERPGREVVLTASVREFPNQGSGCAGIGLLVGKAVRTSRPAGKLAVYDGSESPPRHLLVSEMRRREFLAS
jgi:hypothetical protein